MKRIAVSLFFLCASSSNAIAVELLPIEDFVSFPQYRSVKISPDGHHLVVVAPFEGINHLVFLDISDIDRPKQVSLMQPPRLESIDDVYWVNDERVIYTTSIVQGALESPRSTGRILAVNLDGKKAKQIWSVEENGAIAYLNDLANDDPDFIVISHYGRNRSKPIVEKLNVYSGRSSRIGISPLNRGNVLLDHDLNLRFAIGENDDLHYVAAYRKTPNGDWTEFASPLEGDTLPLGISGDNRTVFVTSDDSERMGVHALDLETGDVSAVTTHQQVEAYAALWSRDGKDLIGVEFLPGYPEVHFVNDLHPDRGLWESLLAAFDGMHVRITSVTRDLSVAIIATFSDRQPPTYYVFDIANGQLNFLVAAMPQIDPQLMANTETHRIAARDGVEFQLYVTKPRDAGDEPRPTIMYIHGGPHGPRDEWRFQPETQMLANRGYTVIQPNYRGSGGFGEDFEKSGYRKWYAEMQDDITDATLWAIEQGLADADRICIYGASYGGYATLAGVTKEPDLYACGFAFVGVYDLELMKEYGDIQERRSGRNYLDLALGDDPEDLKARSPINFVSNIKAPLYIVHGQEDVRAHVQNFYQLRDKLQAENIPFEQLLVEKEGHGFYNMKNRILYAKELLRFFDQNIGSASQQAMADH